MVSRPRLPPLIWGAVMVVLLLLLASTLPVSAQSTPRVTSINFTDNGDNKKNDALALGGKYKLEVEIDWIDQSPPVSFDPRNLDLHFKDTSASNPSSNIVAHLDSGSTSPGGSGTSLILQYDEVEIDLTSRHSGLIANAVFSNGSDPLDNNTTLKFTLIKYSWNIGAWAQPCRGNCRGQLRTRPVTCQQQAPNISGSVTDIFCSPEHTGEAMKPLEKDVCSFQPCRAGTCLEPDTNGIFDNYLLCKCDVNTHTGEFCDPVDSTTMSGLALFDAEAAGNQVTSLDAGRSYWVRFNFAPTIEPDWKVAIFIQSEPILTSLSDIEKISLLDDTPQPLHTYKVTIPKLSKAFTLSNAVMLKATITTPVGPKTSQAIFNLSLRSHSWQAPPPLSPDPCQKSFCGAVQFDSFQICQRSIATSPIPVQNPTPPLHVADRWCVGSPINSPHKCTTKACTNNQGTCQSSTHTCECQSGFGGEHCEMNIPPFCNNGQCANGGFIVGIGADSCQSGCTCINSWQGDSCKTCPLECSVEGVKPDSGRVSTHCNHCYCRRGFVGAKCDSPAVYFTLRFIGVPTQFQVGQTNLAPGTLSTDISLQKRYFDDVIRSMILGISLRQTGVPVTRKAADFSVVKWSVATDPNDPRTKVLSVTFGYHPNAVVVPAPLASKRVVNDPISADNTTGSALFAVAPMSPSSSELHLSPRPNGITTRFRHIADASNSSRQGGQGPNTRTWYNEIQEGQAQMTYDPNVYELISSIPTHEGTPLHPTSRVGPPSGYKAEIYDPACVGNNVPGCPADPTMNPFSNEDQYPGWTPPPKAPKKPTPTWVWIVIGASVGGALLLGLFIMAICCCRSHEVCCWGAPRVKPPKPVKQPKNKSGVVNPDMQPVEIGAGELEEDPYISQMRTSMSVSRGEPSVHHPGLDVGPARPFVPQPEPGTPYNPATPKSPSRPHAPQPPPQSPYNPGGNDELGLMY